MNARIILSVIIIALAGIAAMLPQKSNNMFEVDSKDILIEIESESNIISVDDLAGMLINKDPSLIVVDVRDTAEYKKYSLSGALNIPMEDVLNEEWEGLFSQEARNIVLYSNGSSKATEAWMAVRKQGYTNSFILQGGLNEWFDKIIDPKEPKKTDSNADFSLYSKRLGFKQYFTGSKVESSNSTDAATPTFTVKKKKSVSGGCG